MSSEPLLKVLLPPANISVLFGLVLVLGSNLFVFLTEQTFKVDPVTTRLLAGDQNTPEDQQKAAKEYIKRYTRDSIWRVGLVTSILSSIVSIFIMSWDNRALEGLFVILVIGVFALVFAFLHKNPHPQRIRQQPLFKNHFPWLNRHLAGTL